MYRVLYIALIVVLIISSKGFCSRKALVIGNANYQFGKLKNPVNDAEDISNALRDVGFEVNLLVDADLNEIEKGIFKFSSKLSSDDIALFYYAGHAIQHNEENYLLPINSRLIEEIDLEEISYKLTEVINNMQKSDLSIVILDACRDNPFNNYYRSQGSSLTRSYRGIGLKPKVGLAYTRRAQGTFIAYATDPGSVAFDGGGRNGVFTKYLLRYIRMPGYRLEDVFKRVREEVIQETNSMQIPWDSSSITGVFFFVKPQDKIIKKEDKNIFTPVF